MRAGRVPLEESGDRKAGEKILLIMEPNHFQPGGQLLHELLPILAIAFFPICSLKSDLKKFISGMANQFIKS